MRDEISAAVLFLTRLIGKNENLSAVQVEHFRIRLCHLLQERFQDHWFPDKPDKGQGYRCIRVNELDRIDPILKRAAQECGLKYEDLQLPMELTIWVDPDEVCCRFGEHKGSYCILASFKEGNKENYVDNIRFEDWGTKSLTNINQKELSQMFDVPKEVSTVLVAGQQQHFLEQSNQHIRSHPHHQSVALYRSPPTHCYFIPLGTNSTSPSPPVISTPPLSIASTSTSTLYNTATHPFGLLSPSSHPAITQRIGYTLGPVATMSIPSSSTSQLDRYHWMSRSLIKT